ncbi:MAG: hypothetical protein ACFFD4_07700 [Candidatus Odinarchaeota archaeon]
MNIVDFAEKHYILPETKQPIKLEPHQKRILKDCFTLDKHGKFPYQTIIYAAPKKSGKTEIESLVGLWYSTRGEAYNEIYFLANDQEQSQSRGFKRAQRVIQVTPQIDWLTQSRYTIFNTRTHTEAKALSCDYAGEAGANPGLTLWDELWAYVSENARRLWDEMTPVPTRKNSLRFIVTYAGFEGESDLLWELYQLGLKGRCVDSEYNIWINDEASLYMYWDHKPRMPWQTESYYKRQRQNLRPTTYMRLHENNWVSSVSGFIPIDNWDACVHDMEMAAPAQEPPLFIGVDIGTKRDSTAIVAVYWENKQLKLGRHFIWQPSRGETLDFESTIENYILQLKSQYRIAAVYYDPSQFVRSAQLLENSGIALYEYTQVPLNLTAMTQTLFEFIRSRNLHMYPAPDLREQCLDCVIIEGSRGMRIAKEKASHKIDAIVALAMACQAAWEGAGHTSLPESQPEQNTIWNPGGSPWVVEDEGIVKPRWRI